MKKGIYANIIELAKNNDAYHLWAAEVGPKRSLEDYLDDYSDRNIVESFLYDMLPTNINFKVYPQWEEGGLNWKETKIEIL